MAYTLTDVLHHHGIPGTGDTLTDNAREAGLIWACHGCGSVAGINPLTVAPGEVEVARKGTRDAIDFDVFECCEGADLTVF